MALSIQTYSEGVGPKFGADKTQTGEREAPVLFGPWPLACEIKSTGGHDSSLAGSWSEGMVSERSKDEREWSEFLDPAIPLPCLQVGTEPVHVSRA